MRLKWFQRFSGFFRAVYARLDTRVFPFFRRINGHTALALAGMLGPIILIVGDLTAGFSTPGYSMVRNSISSLALTHIGWLQTIGFLALGLLVEVFAAGLLYNVRHARWFNFGVFLFVFFGFAMLLIGAFRTDPMGMARTTDGRIHGMTATATFSLFPIAILCLLPSIRRDDNWKHLYGYSVVTCILGLIFLGIVKFTQETSGWFGLAERLLVANMVFWVETAAVRLLVLSLSRKTHPPFVAHTEMETAPAEEPAGGQAAT